MISDLGHLCDWEKAWTSVSQLVLQCRPKAKCSLAAFRGRLMTMLCTRHSKRMAKCPFVGLLCKLLVARFVHTSLRSHTTFVDRVATDRDTGQSRGFGFVSFSSEEAATKAVSAMHESDLGGRTITVRMAGEKPPERKDGDNTPGKHILSTNNVHQCLQHIVM